MLVLITYDVKTDSKAGQKRLRQIAKICENFGQRVQFSVFECKVDPAQWTDLRAKLLQQFHADEDSLRFY
ncbi:MAG: CRISPR-associated endonuclease Cas2, partial [Tepidisphaeraceae bacterium]